MHLQFRRFQLEYYPEYASWFVDPELNRQLGPMDKDWLDAVLSEAESEGVTWAVFRENEMIAVVETFFDLRDQLAVIITGLATKPPFRGQGIGTAVLRMILSYHQHRGITKHIAYISVNNSAGQRCAEKAGFLVVTSKPDEHGFIKLQHDSPLHNP
jgi:RimJ/RimL family protein N-acetyltransferase